MNPIPCPSCGQNNNPSFRVCWKCGFSLVPGDPNPAPVPQKVFPVVGFWKRLLSDIIDSFILSMVGTLISLPLRNVLFALGDSAAWIGFAISFFYTGILQSSIGKGQSLAKKILGIQVVKLDGTFLSLPMSFVRYSVLACFSYGPLMMSLFAPLAEKYPGYGVEIAIASIFMAFGIGCTLLAAWHPQKRGLQDYAAGTVVVPVDQFNKAEIDALYDAVKVKRAFFVCVLLTAAFTALAVVIPKLAPAELMELKIIKLQIEKKTKFTKVEINMNFPMDSKKASLQASGSLPKDIFDNEEERLKNQDEAAKIISTLSTARKEGKLEQIVVSATTGFNMGISHFGVSDTVQYNPAGERIDSKKATSSTLPVLSEENTPIAVGLPADGKLTE